MVYQTRLGLNKEVHLNFAELRAIFLLCGCYLGDARGAAAAAARSARSAWRHNQASPGKGRRGSGRVVMAAEFLTGSSSLASVCLKRKQSVALCRFFMTSQRGSYDSPKFCFKTKLPIASRGDHRRPMARVTTLVTLQSTLGSECHGDFYYYEVTIGRDKED